MVSEHAFRVRLKRPALGSTFELLLDGDRDEHTLADMAEEAFDEVRRLEAQLSVYSPVSELSWINQTAYDRPVLVEPGLFDLLGAAKWLHAKTAGAFDITIGPLVRCWGFHLRQGRVPSEVDLRAAVDRVGMVHVELDAAHHLVQFARPGIELNLGAIGKGYVVDRVADLLTQWGVECALIQTGGSTVCVLGAPPVSSGGWRLGIRPGGSDEARLGSVVLRDACISTSGDYEQYFVADGRRYGHVLDPRTGHPVEGVRAASCIGPSATICDALSTAFVVMGVEETRAYCASHAESAILQVEATGGVPVVHQIGCDLETEEQ